MIELLAPIFVGEWAALGEGLRWSPRAARRGVPVAALVRRPALLADVLRRHALGHGCADLRPVASAWATRYLAVLLPPVVALSTALERAVPLGADDVRVEFDRDGGPAAFHVGDLGREAMGEPAGVRYASLVEAHLQPLFAAVSQAARLPRKVLWSNAAHRFELLFEAAERLAPGSPVTAADRDGLLALIDRMSGMRDPARARHAAAAGASRRECCLAHLLPGEGACAGCPLVAASARRSGG